MVSRNSRHGITVAALVLSALLAGCSSTSLSSLMGSKPAAAGAAGTDANASAPAPLAFECPSVTVRDGAATLSVSANPADQSAVNMKYQVTIGQTARECRLVGQTVMMKVGVQGRVILGPAGAPGQVDVPMRLAVVKTGVDQQAITTKSQRVSVTVPEGNTNVLFTQVEDELSFPMPKGAEIDDYVVYVGFDPVTAEEMDKTRKRPAPAKSPKPAKPKRTS